MVYPRKRNPTGSPSDIPIRSEAQRSPPKAKPLLTYTKPKTMIYPQPIPAPYPSLLIPFPAQNAASNAPSNRFPLLDPDAAREAYLAKRAEWAKLTLRQDWPDEQYMRGHLRAAGLRSPDRAEPATVGRLRSLLRRAGIDGIETVASVGTSLAGFLTLNPSLPLWAAAALVLESVGRFTSRAEVNPLDHH